MNRRIPSILVVDDDPHVLHFLQHVLQISGYRVNVTGSGAVALKMIDKQAPDLLVLDLAMPEPDGFEMLQKLRDRESDLPILVISGYLHGAMLHAATILGATAALEKPIAPITLLGAVGNLCGLPGRTVRV
ncbi:MAG: response regulator [Bryobacteraceae bacterium]